MRLSMEPSPNKIAIFETDFYQIVLETCHRDTDPETRKLLIEYNSLEELKAAQAYQDQREGYTYTELYNSQTGAAQ